MSQSKTCSSVEDINSYSAAETLTSCHTSMNISGTGSTQSGPVFPFRGYYSSSNEELQAQPVFPSDAKILSGTTFRIESGTPFKSGAAASQNDFKARVLGNSFEPNNLH